MKLVNAEEVRQIFDYEVAQGATDLFDAFDSAIENATEVDAVEVVRCKNCKHYWKNVNTPGYSGKCTTVNDDDFCSHGERKDNG